MAGSGRIVVAAHEETVTAESAGLKPGRYIRLSVTDSGEGMDEATLARAMEPFFTTKGIGKGTGLGLSMIHGMAAQSGGELILRSRKGEGTTAELWLPAVAEDIESFENDLPVVPSLLADAKGATRTVLAVDDDALVLMNTAAMLEDLGHKVFQAHSGSAALEILGRERHIDLMIADYAMPQMTGAQLVEAIRAERPDLPIILATGYAELPPGMALDLPKLTKPFRQEELARAVAAATGAAAISNA